MDGNGRYDDGVIGISSQDFNMDYGYDSNEWQRRRMRVVLGGYAIGDHRYLADKLVCEEAEGKNCGGCSRETDIRTLYRRKEDGGFQ